MAPQSDAPLAESRDAEARQQASGRDGEDGVVGRTVTIGRPRDEVNAFWRDFSNFAGIMENIERIDKIELDTEFLISHRAGLEDGPALYKHWHDEQNEYTKIVLTPGMAAMEATDGK